MTEETQTPPDHVWKLGLAIAFLAFSLWLSLAPLWDLDGDRAERGERELVTRSYGGFVSEADLLRRYASFSGEANLLPDPFAWFDPKPDPGPGGIAQVEVAGETGLSAEIVETEVSAEEEDPIPQIQVRLILRARASARALVDGQVLGIGDMTKAGKIVEILDSGIHTMYRGKKLFFALSHR